MEVTHHPEKCCFVIALANDSAVLEYTLGPQGVVDFTHTYVPSAFRGQGYAEILVKEGLSWAKQQGLKVQASCWYVRGFLE